MIIMFCEGYILWVLGILDMYYKVVSNNCMVINFMEMRICDFGWVSEGWVIEFFVFWKIWYI